MKSTLLYDALNDSGYLLVPKLLLGNPECEALASQYRKLELLDMSSQAGAWELADLGTSGILSLMGVPTY